MTVMRRTARPDAEQVMRADLERQLGRVERLRGALLYLLNRLDDEKGPPR